MYTKTPIRTVPVRETQSQREESNLYSHVAEKEDLVQIAKQSSKPSKFLRRSIYQSPYRIV